MNDFRTLPAGTYQTTLTIQKSRFLAFAVRVDSGAAAQNFIKTVALPDATHHCYAYLTADGQKSNDNGEPSGTAGLPILQAIKSAGLFNVVVVVERYFGGVKLGTGGLARAYGQAASQVLSSVIPVWLRDCAVFSLTSTYEQQSAMQQVFQKYGAQVVPVYQDNIQWRVTVPVALRDNLLAELSEVIHGQPVWQMLTPHAWVEFPA